LQIVFSEKNIFCNGNFCRSENFFRVSTFLFMWFMWFMWMGTSKCSMHLKVPIVKWSIWMLPPDLGICTFGSCRLKMLHFQVVTLDIWTFGSCHYKIVYLETLELSFYPNYDFLIPLSLQPNVVDLIYFKL